MDVLYLILALVALAVVVAVVALRYRRRGGVIATRRRQR